MTETGGYRTMSTRLLDRREVMLLLSQFLMDKKTPAPQFVAAAKLYLEQHDEASLSPEDTLELIRELYAIGDEPNEAEAIGNDTGTD